MPTSESPEGLRCNDEVFTDSYFVDAMYGLEERHSIEPNNIGHCSAHEAFFHLANIAKVGALDATSRGEISSVLVLAAEDAVIVAQGNGTVSGDPADVVAELEKAAQAWSSWGDSQPSIFQTTDVDPQGWIEGFTALIWDKIPRRARTAQDAALKAKSAFKAGNLKLDALTDASLPTELAAAQELFRTSLAWANLFTTPENLGKFADLSTVGKIDSALTAAEEAKASSCLDLTVSSPKRTSSAISDPMTELQAAPVVGAEFWDDIRFNHEQSQGPVSKYSGSLVGEPTSDE